MRKERRRGREREMGAKEVVREEWERRRVERKEEMKRKREVVWKGREREGVNEGG